jgi:hypothetical protein
MSEQIIGNLSNGLKNVTVPRKRALQLLGGAIAVAAPSAASQVPQAAEAGKHRKPPEAFVVATLSNPTAADETTFRLEVQAAVHPASKTTVEFTTSVFPDSNVSADQMRKQIATGLKGVAESQLNGVVPRDRIAVTLL